MKFEDTSLTPLDLTVSALVERDGRFLIIEELSSGSVVLNQPGGHIEPGELPEDAVVREAMEESGCEIEVTSFLGFYMWSHPQTGQNFLRLAYEANVVKQNKTHHLDAGILGVHWLTLHEIENHNRNIRSPLVLEAINGYLARQDQGSLLFKVVSHTQKR